MSDRKREQIKARKLWKETQENRADRRLARFGKATGKKKEDVGEKLPS